MSLTITEKLEGATAELDNRRQATYARVFQVESDTLKLRPGTAINAVMSTYGIQIGTAYKVLDPADNATVLEEDAGSFCQKISSSLQGQADDGCTFDVSVSYGPAGGDSQVFPANPVDHPIKISWGFARYEKVVEEDTDGKAIVNSAGDYFDPPITTDDTRPVLKIVRNEATYDPILADNWKDRVNEDAWWIFKPGTVKAGEFTAELAYNPECGFYFVVSYEFEINPDGWKRKVLDQGLRTLDPDTDKVAAILDDKGQPVSSPVLLDGNGGKLASGDDPVFMEFEIYKTATFADLNFDFATAPGYVS